MAKKFNDIEKNNFMTKQSNYSYLKPEVRRTYLLKAKFYLEDYLGYNPEGINTNFYKDEIFKDLKYALKRVEKEIKNNN